MLSSIKDLHILSKMLGVKYSFLFYYLNKKPEDDKYRKFEIRKRSGGIREISAPDAILVRWQRILADLFLSTYKPRGCVHGFVKKRNIKSNAAMHQNRRFVFNIDIKDYFPSIHFGRVVGALVKPPYNMNQKVATYVAKICCYQSRLPQGAPSSPILSNIVCARLDTSLGRLAKKYYCKYSRYADDITFSKQSHNFPREISGVDATGATVVGEELQLVFSNNDFVANNKKTHFQTNKHRQVVTGLIVNQKVNVQRRFIRNIRAMINDWDKNGYDAAQEHHWADRIDNKKPPLRQVVLGKLDHVRFIKGNDDEVYVNLAKRLAKVDSEFNKILLRRNLEASMRDFFISHASEDKNGVARPLAEELVRAGKKVWFDEYELKIGDSLRAKIEDGLVKSLHGIVILSHNFFAKHWPIQELNGLWSKEGGGGKVILPVWFNISKTEVASYAPMLSDRIAILTDGTDIPRVASEIIKAV